MEMLDDTGSIFPQYPVGLQLRVGEILHLLNSNEYVLHNSRNYAKVLGIWGNRGIGKTTIARVIYNDIMHHFTSTSFLPNVKNVWEQVNGPIHLQKQLISDVSDEESMEIHDIQMGVRELEKTLRNKKVLVILDDVSHIDQLIALCGSENMFSGQSLVIITTRDKELLDHFNHKLVYEMRKMNKVESLQLFHYHAFRQSLPSNHFMNLSNKAITYCEGLPLALEVIGSLLHGRTIAEWKSLVKKLRGIPDGQIQEKLKISYDLLTDREKEIFINIACFYVGKREYDVEQEFFGSKFPIKRGIDVLIDRSLIKISGMYCKFHVHGLLQEIARGINPNDSMSSIYTYDIFLSFRGEDTRKAFATHLYTALTQAGIKVFMDNELRKGEDISSSLLQAIEASRMSIIIFSTNYAGSKWCLQELEAIMECHRTKGQEVLPVFYGVQPTEVRKQINAFGKAFENLTKNKRKASLRAPKKRNLTSKEEELSWKRTLTEVSNLSGWDLHNYRTETELIDNILEDVAMKLEDNTNLFVAHHPVGLGSRVQDIIQLHNNKSDEVIIVGIWGMGGIGKSTIAKAIYNAIGPRFEGKSFLADIRGVWEQDNRQGHLQQLLLSNILKTRNVALPSIDVGKAIIKERLCHKRALVVLDDVSNVDQLNALCGSRAWFGRGSLIIITTRDERLLSILQPVHVHNVKGMDMRESLELFSWHAFKQAIPKVNFLELSKKIISYSGGLPLALEIIGSYLFDRESVLEKLKVIPNDQIHKKLMISYDGLSDHAEKDIFLDICCFFIGKERNYVTQILNGCGLHAQIGITRLIELSLVRVEKNNKLAMHDLIRDMGREIIRKESLEAPEKRTRLWFQKDVLDVLRNNMGTISIKGLALSLVRNKEQSFTTKALKKMKRLQLLQFDNVKLDGEYEHLSKELRWLFWHGFPLRNIPKGFCQENMVAMDLQYSYLTKIWVKSQLMERLKFLNLSHSHYLTQTPDFSKLPNLEKLKFKDCPKLSVVHPTIGDLKHIILINFKDCIDLNHLPRSIYKLKSLKTLNISGCSKIDKLEEDIEQMGSLMTLMANQTAITQVPFSLVRSKSIQYLSLCGYEGLSCNVFPSIIRSWMSPTKNPRTFFQSLGYMPYLLSKSLFVKRSAKLEIGPSTSVVSCLKSQAPINLHEQVHVEGSSNFVSSVTIHVGESNQVIDTLLKNISQGFGNYSLPRDFYPDWLYFRGEGFSVSFQVPQVSGRSLKGVVLCIVYLPTSDNMAPIYPINVMIKDYTKVIIETYKRDAGTTSNDEEWHKLLTNLVPGNLVEVKVDFAYQIAGKETLIYLVYGEDVVRRQSLITNVNIEG